MTTKINYTPYILKHIPNFVVEAVEEPTYAEKIDSYLAAAEGWAMHHIVSEGIFDEIVAGINDRAEVATNFKRLVSAEALIHAVPALDLVMTPNGFGIVSNQNVAPASRERVDALIETLTEQRDQAIEAIVELLMEDTAWQIMTPGEFFLGTIFPSPKACHAFGIHKNRWTEYKKLRYKILQFQNLLEENFISTPLMRSLLTGVYPEITRRLRTVIVGCITCEAPCRTTHHLWTEMAPIVEMARTKPEWDMADLFSSDNVFKNEKSASGYWF